jgi:hypothetical protein
MKRYRGFTIRKMSDGRYDIFDASGLFDENFQSISLAMEAIDYYKG